MILNETQVAIRDGVRAFAQDQIRPNSARYEREGKYPDNLFEKLGSLGLFGLIAPAAYGGADADYVSYALSLIELAAADGALSTIVSIQTLGGYGYLEEFGLAKIYCDVRVCQIYEGTSDIQRMIIARAL